MYVGEACNIHVESPLGVYVCPVAYVIHWSNCRRHEHRYRRRVCATEPSIQQWPCWPQHTGISELGTGVLCRGGIWAFHNNSTLGKSRSWEFFYYFHEKCHAAYPTEVLVQESRFVAGHKQYCIWPCDESILQSDVIRVNNTSPCPGTKQIQVCRDKQWNCIEAIFLLSDQEVFMSTLKLVLCRCRCQTLRQCVIR